VQALFAGLGGVEGLVVHFNLPFEQDRFLHGFQHTVGYCRRQERQRRRYGAHFIRPAGNGVFLAQCVQCFAGSAEARRKNGKYRGRE
jgi:hypothetical protein